MTQDKAFNSLSEAQWIDRACDQFEIAWQENKPVTIESLVETCPVPIRAALINELVSLEMELRHDQGELPTVEEYALRFPGIELNVLELERMLGKNPGSQTANEPTIDSPGLAGARKHDDLTGASIQYLGDYELLEQIARGGMGIVYKARQQTLGRIVAVKMILSGQFAEKQDIDRFRSEATAAAKLDHPGIVPIYEVGEQDGHHFYSMGFVEGGSLAQRLQDGPLPPRESADLLTKIADAVHYAHLKGVIHRDIKPANILIDANGLPRVTDFGLAKLVKGSSDITRSGQILGTPSYMPPEQAAAQASAIGPASDVYSLGALLYALLTGRPPFQAASPIETLLQVQKQEPVSPRQFNANIPIDLETITLKCLDKSPARRYESADELAQELRRYLAGKPILARPVSKAEQAWRWCRRNPAVASLATAILLLISGIAVGSAWAYLRESGLRKDLKVAFENQKELTASERQAKLEEVAARKTADVARREKEDQAAIAEQEKEKAKASEAETRRNLYVADIARIQALIQQSNLQRAKTLLERHIPKVSGDEDLRGFDWYYLWRKVSLERSVFQFTQPVEVIALSHDEKILAVGCDGGFVQLVELDTGQLLDTRFKLDDQHFANLAFINPYRLIGHGRQGGFKLWNVQTGETVADYPEPGSFFHEPGRSSEDRFSISVSRDGRFMICPELAGQLALWHTDVLRPKAFPLINNGLHRRRIDGKESAIVGTMNAIQPGMFSIASTDPRRLDAAGVKNYDELILKAESEHALRDYRPPGIFIPSYNRPKEQETTWFGHPISAISFAPNGNNVVTGSSEGVIQFWNLSLVQDPSQWLSISTSPTTLSKQPILAIAHSADGQMLAICDRSECFVLRMGDTKPFTKMETPEGAYTTVAFVGSDRLAIGTSTGLIDIWSPFESRQLQRIYAGHGAVSQIVVSKEADRFVVANQDGTVRTFDTTEELPPIVPQPALASAHSNASLQWLSHEQKLIYRHGDTYQLNLVDPNNLFEAVQLQNNLNDLTLNDLTRATSLSGVSSSYYERPLYADLISVHWNLIHYWDSGSRQLKKMVDCFQHTDKNGRVHSPASSDHPKASYFFRDGKLEKLPKPIYQQTNGVIASDLFVDQRRLVLICNSLQPTLLVRDLETGEVLSELYVLGLLFHPGMRMATCLDDHRILIPGLTTNLKDSFSLLWDTKTDSLQIIKQEAQNSDTSKKPQVSSFKPPKIARNPSNSNLIAIWSSQQIELWDTAVVVRDSESTRENAERITSSNALSVIRPGENEWFEFVHLDDDGEFFAMLVLMKSRQLRWARWDRDSKSWKTLFVHDEEWYFADATDHRWCFDSKSSILYHMREPGVFQRWNTKGGNGLTPLRVPGGSVDQIQLSNDGIIGITMKAKGSGQLGFPTSSVWIDDNVQLPSEGFRGSDRPWRLPFSTTSQFWLTSQGVRDPHPPNKPSYSVRFEGKTLDAQQSRLPVMLSADDACLLQIQNDNLHEWRLDPRPDSTSDLVYRYTDAIKIGLDGLTKPDGSAPAVDAELIDSASLSPDGNRVAIQIGTRLKWSKRPFHDWKNAALPIPSDSKITSPKWSTNNTTVAVGVTSGDVVVFDTENESAKILVRGHDGPIHDLLWLPDQRTLATAGEDGNIVLWDYRQQEVRLKIAAHSGPAKSLAFDRKANTLFSGGEDGVVRRWQEASVSTKDDNKPVVFEVPSLEPPFVEKTAPAHAMLLRNRSLARALRMQLSANFTVSSFGFGQFESEKSEMADILKIPEMTVNTISLEGNALITDADLKLFIGMSELRSLNLAKCKLTAEGLKQLQRLRGLHTIDLSSIDLTGFDFATLKESTNLLTLRLSSCSLTDDQLLKIIQLFPKLRELDLAHNPLSDVSVAEMKSLSLLKSLNLSSTRISSPSLAALSGLRNLVEIDLSHNDLSGEDMLKLAGPTFAMTRIRARGLQIDDRWLNESMADQWKTVWRILYDLDLRDTQVTENGVRKFLQNHPTVKTYVSPKLFGDNPELMALLELGPLRGQVIVDHKSLPVIVAIGAIQKGGSITGLTWPIDIERSQEDIDVLKKLPKLERIQLGSDASGKKHLPVLPMIASMKELHIKNPSHITAALRKPLAQCQQLQRLTMERVDDEDLKAIQQLPALMSLVYGSSVSIDKIVQSLPQLKELTCESFDIKATAITKEVSLEKLSVVRTLDKKSWPAISMFSNLKELNVPSSLSSIDLKKLNEQYPAVRVKKLK